MITAKFILQDWTQVTDVTEEFFEDLEELNLYIEVTWMKFILLNIREE
jgi:hypothetical protein